jgi:hypothetical protein
LFPALAIDKKAAIALPYTDVKLLLIIALLVGPAGIAAADIIPLPRPRPANLNAGTTEAPPAEETADSAEQKKADEPPPPSACLVRLRELAVVRPLPSINKAGGCFAEDVVQLDGIILADKRQVTVEPAATLRCGMAQAMADWVRDEVAPAAVVALGSPLRAIENAASFECRGRNNIPGALLSEHGKANALDIRALKLVNGSVAQLTDANLSKDFRDGLRKSACARFMTVLGPGSDGYHEDHIHVDLAERKGDYRLCQWEVRQPIYRMLLSPHIVGYGKPSPHVAPASMPVAPVAAAAKADDKVRPVSNPRKL